MFYTINNIGNNSTGGRKLSCSLAVKNNVSGCVAAHHNTIENIIHVGQLTIPGNQHRANNALQTAVRRFADLTNQFDHTAPGIRVFHVGK